MCLGCTDALVLVQGITREIRGVNQAKERGRVRVRACVGCWLAHDVRRRGKQRRGCRQASEGRPLLSLAPSPRFSLHVSPRHV